MILKEHINMFYIYCLHSAWMLLLYMGYAIGLNTMLIIEPAVWMHIVGPQRNSDFSKSNTALIMWSHLHMFVMNRLCERLDTMMNPWSGEMKGGAGGASMRLHNAHPDGSALKLSPTFDCFFFRLLSSFCCFFINFRYVCSGREMH